MNVKYGVCVECNLNIWSFYISFWKKFKTERFKKDDNKPTRVNTEREERGSFGFSVLVCW